MGDKENYSTPIELTEDDIGLGMQRERIIILESQNPQYKGKAVRVRALRGREFRTITQGVQLRGKEDINGAFRMALEACKVGILTPGIAKRLDDLDHDVIEQIGNEILAASEPKEEAVEDFSKAQPGSSVS